jgi:hypothetical protein
MMMAPTTAARKPVSILLGACLLFGHSLMTTMSVNGEDGAEPDIEILSFEIPEKVRIHERFVARATIRNGGPATTFDLRVEFKNDNIIINHSTVHELGSSNSTEVTVEMWTGWTVGAIENYSVVAAGKSMTVARQVKAPLDTRINIKDFGAKTVLWRSEGGTLLQYISFNLTLENEGELAGHVTVVITCSKGWVEIFRDDVAVNGNSDGNLTVDSEYRGPLPEYPSLLMFRAKLEGDLIGEHNTSWADTPISGGYVQTGPTTEASLVIFFDGVIVAIGVALLLEWNRQRKKKARSPKMPLIRRINWD